MHGPCPQGVYNVTEKENSHTHNSIKDVANIIFQLTPWALDTRTVVSLRHRESSWVSENKLPMNW